MVQRAGVDVHGRYLFTGVGAGIYDVVASMPGYSPAREQNVRVDPPDPVLIKESLVLAPLGRLEVFIHPPVDPAGKPWQLSLLRPLPLSTYDETVDIRSVSPAGSLRLDDLQAGSYGIRLQTHDGRVVHRQKIGVDGATRLSIHVESVILDGTVVQGDEPVAGTVILIADDGTRFTFRANDDGMFHGVLPREGEFRVGVRLRGEGRGTVNLDKQMEIEGARTDMRVLGSSFRTE